MFILPVIPQFSRKYRMFNLTELFATYTQRTRLRPLQPTDWLRQTTTTNLILRESKLFNPCFTLIFQRTPEGYSTYTNLNDSGVVLTKRGKGGATWCNESLYVEAKRYLEKEGYTLFLKEKIAEEASLKTIEQILGIKLIRQYPCAQYRLDGYDVVNNIAYEVDGGEHFSKSAEDAQRELEITAVLNCSFVRVKVY